MRWISGRSLVLDPENDLYYFRIYITPFELEGELNRRIYIGKCFCYEKAEKFCKYLDEIIKETNFVEFEKMKEIIKDESFK